MRMLLVYSILIPVLAKAQVGAIEYFSSNGDYRLVCVPSIDTAAAYNILFHKGDTEPLWEKRGLEMKDNIGVSNSGKVVWLTDICTYHVNGFCLENLSPDSMVLHIAGLPIKLGRVLSERLYELPVDPENKPLGILLNDTIIHKMAENPFFIDDGKVFVCTKPATLNVFDVNTGAVIYIGPGRAHFTSNYYSIPRAPYKKVYPLNLPDSASFQIPTWEDRKRWLQPESSSSRPSPEPME